MGVVTSLEVTQSMKSNAGRLGKSAELSLLAFDEIIRTIAFAGTEPVLQQIVPYVRDLLEADKSIAYRFDMHGERPVLDFLFGHGVGPEHRFRCTVTSYLAKKVGQVTGYRLPVPDPKDRNTVYLLKTEKDREAFAQVPLVRELFPLVGLQGQDQIRVLVCDGPHLLAWVGAFRQHPFSEREAERLALLVEPLRRRLKLEESLRRLSVMESALDVALEALGSPAFLLDHRGRVVHANAAGRVLSREERRQLVDRGKGVLAGRMLEDPSLSLLRVHAEGLPPHSFLVQHAAGSVEARLAAFAMRWRLTRRQRDVLRRLLDGKTNKVIAADLGIEEGTVELHVTALLRKVGAENRSELIARFWREPF